MLLHRGETVLRKPLRTFEENQLSNIIRRTKGKRTLKFHQFYNIQRLKISERLRISLENHSSPTENIKKPIFLSEKPLKNRKTRKTFFEIFLTSILLQNFKKLKGDSLESLKKIFGKKTKNETF